MAVYFILVINGRSRFTLLTLILLSTYAQITDWMISGRTPDDLGYILNPPASTPGTGSGALVIHVQQLETPVIKPAVLPSVKCTVSTTHRCKFVGSIISVILARTCRLKYETERLQADGSWYIESVGNDGHVTFSDFQSIVCASSSCLLNSIQTYLYIRIQNISAHLEPIVQHIWD